MGRCSYHESGLLSKNLPTPKKCPYRTNCTRPARVLYAPLKFTLRPIIGCVGRHRHVDLWKHLRVQPASGKVLVVTDEFTAAKLQIVQQFGQIQTLVPWAEWLQMSPAAVVKLSGTASVAAAEVMQADGYLNQALIKRARWIATLHPKIFPNFVRLEKIFFVEPTDSLEISRIVAIFLHELCLFLVPPATNFGDSVRST